MSIFRYYRGRVLDVSTMLYYKVIFDDKSFCFDLPPQDIEVSLWKSCANKEFSLSRVA